MPNRIIHESAFTSEKIAALTDFEFRLWVGLITLADDLGRGDARPAIVRGRLFPFHEKLTNRTVERALEALEKVGCIERYTVKGKPYFCFPRWEDHQRVRSVRPKYPGPEEADAAADGGKVRQNAANGGEARPESESESENESKTKSESENESESELKSEPTGAQAPRCAAKRGVGWVRGDFL